MVWNKTREARVKCEVLEILKDEQLHTGWVYMACEQRAICFSTDRVRVSASKLAEDSPGITERQAEYALKRLEVIGLIKVTTIPRRYTEVQLLRRSVPEIVPENVSESVPAKRPKNQRVLKKIVPEIVPGIVPEIVDGSAVNSSSPAVSPSLPVVDVSDSVESGQQEKGRAREGRAISAKPTTMEILTRTVPNFKDLTFHIDTLYAVQTGFKYPWKGTRDFVLLSQLVAAYNVPTIMAASDYFFTGKNVWAHKKGYRILEFQDQLGRILDNPEFKNRVRLYEKNLDGAKPPAYPETAITTKADPPPMRASEKAKAVEVLPEPDMSDREAHDLKLKNLKVCRVNQCQFCRDTAVENLSDADLLAAAGVQDA
ncbi:MAG: hypothetical protein DMF62_02350 [Acidobacteria bacterium]|nr:MAG: hypothetical protein DMF62_02350 [Acidobacteriota bacterium]